MSGPCCTVGGRPDAGAIDAALRAGGADNSFRKLASRHGLSVGALQRHKPHVAGAYRATDTGMDTPGDTPSKRSRKAANKGDTIREAVSAAPKPDARSRLFLPNPGDDPVTAPRKLATADVELQCVKMRVSGKSYEEIAAALGVHWETAMDSVERVLIRTRGKADALAEQAREIELRRCDAIIASFWDRATDPSMADVDVPADTDSGVRAYDGQDKAADRLLKAMERRAKLLGLDAPTGPSVQITLVGGEFGRGVVSWLRAVAPQLVPQFIDWGCAVQSGDQLARDDPGAWTAAQGRRVVEMLPDGGGEEGTGG